MGKLNAPLSNTQIGQVIRDLHLPLSNLEYTIEQHLLTHGLRIDAETRLLLASVRDCVGNLAACTRHLTVQACPDDVSAQPMARRARGIGRAA